MTLSTAFRASGIALLAATLAACSASDTASSESPLPQPTAISMINGEVPPGTPTSLVEEVTLLTVSEDGRETFISRTTRAPGTRAPFHFHPNGGSTCVEAGEMTLYLEGAEPLTAGPGECYWMPAGRPMTAYNSGNVDVVSIESYNFSDGEKVFDAVEEVQPIPEHGDHDGS
ncbi:MAG: cupin domain-containing protein [Actinomycetota bacterium]|nr:cupin domain-containing protein [Actinomycetota bacterium]